MRGRGGRGVRGGGRGGGRGGRGGRGGEKQKQPTKDALDAEMDECECHRGLRQASCGVRRRASFFCVCG